MQSVRRQNRRVILALILLGAICVSSRFHIRQKAKLAREDSVWRVTYNVSFQSDKPATELKTAIPLDSAYCRVFRQDVSHVGLSSQRLRPLQAEVREIVATAQGQGDFRLKAEFELHLSRRARGLGERPPVNLSAEARAHYLRDERDIQLDSPAVQGTLADLRGDQVSKEELAERLFEYCSTNISSGDSGAAHGAAESLDSGVASTVGRARALVALSRAAKLPARLVTGFEIKRGLNAQPHIWVEVLLDRRWEPFDPENGFSRELPHNFVAVRRDGVDIVRSNGAREVQTSFSILRLPLPRGVVASDAFRPTQILDLTRLPLEMQQAVSVILLLPLGALITAFCRNVVGFRTFGTFAPALLALSFVYADWKTGLGVLLVVLLIGLVGRWMLERLKLLMVPRLSVMLTLVVVCLVFGVSLLDYLRLTPSAQAVLLPLVILTLMIERLYVTGEEDGVKFTFQLFLGTFVVAVFCYMLLGWDEVGRVVLAYPEIHLFTIATLIAIGSYAGYRLTELWRFRELVNVHQPSK